MVQWRMFKTKAIELLGGSITAAAEAIGISYQAVNQWPDVLPDRIADRVQAALARKTTQELAQAPVKTAQAAIDSVAQGV